MDAAPQSARPTPCPTWRRTLAAWAIATGVLMALALPVSKMHVMTYHADIGLGIADGMALVSADSPWEPSTAPSFNGIDGWNRVTLRGLPSFSTSSELAFGVHPVTFAVPFWLVAALGGVVAAWVWRRRQGRRAGSCPCGYSLAGLAAGAVCPECGAKSTA